MVQIYIYIYISSRFIYRHLDIERAYVEKSRFEIMHKNRIKTITKQGFDLFKRAYVDLGPFYV